MNSLGVSDWVAFGSAVATLVIGAATVVLAGIARRDAKKSSQEAGEAQRRAQESLDETNEARASAAATARAQFELDVVRSITFRGGEVLQYSARLKDSLYPFPQRDRVDDATWWLEKEQAVHAAIEGLRSCVKHLDLEFQAQARVMDHGGWTTKTESIRKASEMLTEAGFMLYAAIMTKDEALYDNKQEAVQAIADEVGCPDLPSTRPGMLSAGFDTFETCETWFAQRLLDTVWAMREMAATNLSVATASAPS